MGKQKFFWQDKQNNVCMSANYGVYLRSSILLFHIYPGKVQNAGAGLLLVVLVASSSWMWGRACRGEKQVHLQGSHQAAACALRQPAEGG